MNAETGTEFTQAGKFFWRLEWLDSPRVIDLCGSLFRKTQNIGKFTIKETVNYLDIMDRHHAEENPRNIMKAKKTKKWLLLISIWIIKLKLQIDILLVVVGYGCHFNLLYDTFGQRPDLNNESAVRLRIRKRGVDHVCRERRTNYNENSVFCFKKPVLASGRQWHLHLEIENSPSN